MDATSRIAVLLLTVAASNLGLAFHGSMDCPDEKTCYFSRGHYYFHTEPSGPDGKYFKVHDVTKDHTTTFDITFIVKNIKNLDSTQTMLTVGVKNVGPSDKFYYSSVTSTRDKIIRYKDITMARIALLSFQKGVTVDIYYFMDCDLQARQFARIDYPERSPFTVPILKMFNTFTARQIIDTRPQKTCWFIIPKDSLSGREKVDTTYVLLNNASVFGDGKLKVSNAITGKTLLSYPDSSFNSDIAVSDEKMDIGNVSVEIGTRKSLATTVFFVDLICSTPWLPNCRRDSKFSIMFKPLSDTDRNCLRSEDYCKFGYGMRATQNVICKPGDRIPANRIFTSNGGITTTSCPGVQDLLNAVSLSWMHGSFLSKLTNMVLPPQSERRMGTFGKCANLGTYCSSIRSCSRQGSCGAICLMCHIRGICDSVSQYYPYYHLD